MGGHGAEAGRAVGFERVDAARVGRSEDQVRIARRVVGVEVRDEDAGQLLHA